MTFNTRQLTQLTTALFSALLIACHSPEPATVTPDATIATVQPPLTVTDGIVGIYKDYPLDPDVLVGDTTILKKILKLHTPPVQAPDLTALKNNDDPDLKGKPHRYIAVGGSLTAGVRDGGLYQDAQQTSFPNMLARQMKLQSFKQPLFADNEYNGYGYKTIGFNPFGTGIPYYNAVKNNTAFKSKDKGYVELNKDNNSSIDNYGVPFLSFYNLNLSGFVVRNSSASDRESSNLFYERFYETSTDYNSKLNKNPLNAQKFDFYTLEIGLDDYVNAALRGSNAPSYATAPIDYVSPTYKFLQYTQTIKAKGCIANVPYILDFPYFNFVTVAQIKKVLGTNDIYYEGQWNILDSYKIIPTASIDSILNTKNTLKKRGSYNYPIRRVDVLPYIDNLKSYIDSYNSYYTKWGKEFNVPIVDLNTLFKKVFEGSLTSTAGTKVNPTFKTGNFFSSDGLHPTAFGQAIIANEFIRTFNAFYKTNIPLINEDEYLTK